MVFNFLLSQIMKAFRVHNEKWLTESLTLNCIRERSKIPTYKTVGVQYKAIHKDICIYLHHIYKKHHTYTTYLYTHIQLYIHMFAKKKKSELIFAKTQTINISLNNSTGELFIFPSSYILFGFSIQLYIIYQIKK